MPRKNAKPKGQNNTNVPEFEFSSGNVFADLNLPEAQERQAKAHLAMQIAELLDGKTQKEAAVLLGLDQPKISKILRGQLREFSTDRLLHLLTRLGQNIEIRISPISRGKSHRAKVGHISVRMTTA